MFIKILISILNLSLFIKYKIIVENILLCDTKAKTYFNSIQWIV